MFNSNEAKENTFKITINFIKGSDVVPNDTITYDKALGYKIFDKFFTVSLSKNGSSNLYKIDTIKNIKVESDFDNTVFI